MLGALFACIPDFEPREMGANFQAFLASYKPPPGLWDKETEYLRDHFAMIGPKEYESVYQTYLDLAEGGDTEDPSSGKP